MMIQILLVCTQKYAYVMVCFSTYIFSTSQEFVPTCPGGHGPHVEQDVDQVLYSAMDGRQFHNRQHGDTVPKNARDVFLCFLQINIKKRARCSSVLQATCVLIKLELFLTYL